MHKILVVDDYPDIVNQIIDILLQANPNYYLYQANNGHTAYKAAVSLLPDLIITDWDMPVVNGIEFIRNLKKCEKTKNIPVIMATAVNLSPNDLKKALEAGAVDYIRKPIDAVELIARTQSVLRLSDSTKQIIDLKDKELAENALSLIKNNKFIISITKELENLYDIIPDKTEEITARFHRILDEINNKVKEDSWQRFELSFNSANNSFKKNILEHFPDLTEAELRLAILIKSGLDTKSIASALYLSPDSVKVARSRLRKKLQLTSKDNLSAFLNKF